jgi:hypothetical protein
MADTQLTDEDLGIAPPQPAPAAAPTQPPLVMSQARPVDRGDTPAPDLGPGYWRDASGTPYRETGYAPNQPATAPVVSAAPTPAAAPSAAQTAAQQLTDADLGITAAAPGGPPTIPQRNDMGLGFAAGALKPFDNMATWVDAIPGMHGVDQWLANATGTPNAPIGQTMVSNAAAQGVAPDPLGRFGGGLASGLALTMATRGAGGPTGQGAMLGALNSDHPLQPMQLAGDTAFGAAGGKLGDALLSGLGSVISPRISAAAQALANAEVNLTPGALLGGGLKRAEDAATSIPLVGDLIRGAQHSSLLDFNRAVINRTVAPLGEQVPSNVATGRDALNYAYDRLGREFSDVVRPLQGLKLDPTFQTDVDATKLGAHSLPQTQQDQLASVIKNDVLGRFGADGSITGQNMLDADSKLGFLSRKYHSSPDPDQQALGDAFDAVQSNLRDMISRQAPAAAPRLAAAREGWANLVIAGRAASATGAKEGVFTAPQLSAAVRATNSSANKSQFGRGLALMQDLSDAGQSVLPSSVPDSGSAGRGMLAGLLLGGGHAVHMFMHPETGIPVAALSAAYTKPGQQVLRQAITARPPWAATLRAQLPQLRGAATVGGAMAFPAAANGLTGATQ